MPLPLSFASALFTSRREHLFDYSSSEVVLILAVHWKVYKQGSLICLILREEPHFVTPEKLVWRRCQRCVVMQPAPGALAVVGSGCKVGRQSRRRFVNGEQTCGDVQTVAVLRAQGRALMASYTSSSTSVLGQHR